MNEFEQWWDKFSDTRLHGWSPKEKANLCGIAKAAWNEAVKSAANACEVVAELEGAVVVRKLKA